jgi:hypothetical protein
MALEISNIEDTGMSMDSSGWTRTRKKIVSASTWEELYRGNAFPAHGSRHPENPAFRLESANMTQIGNSDRKIQVLWEGTYHASTIAEAKDPWELDAQDVSIAYSTETAPMLYGYNAKGNPVTLKNSAGCMISAETSHTITDLTFRYCVKAKKRYEIPGHIEPLINKNSETVADVKIRPYCGLLMPYSTNLIVEYDDENPNKEVRRYWELQVTIRINPKTWKREYLDVGTMALFGGGIPEPIYQYQPDPDGFKPIYGSIHQHRKAKERYKKDYPDKEMSWTEITEPLPLRNGEIFQEALGSYQNRYNKISLFEYDPVSWSSLDLPKRRA